MNASPKSLNRIVLIALAATICIGLASAQDSTTPSQSTTPTSQSTTPPSQSTTPPSQSGMSPATGITSPASAPTTPETNTMEHYLTNHPQVADELHNNPSLINNPQWLAQHPEVNNWMTNHPNVKADALSNPQSFVNHTERETLTKDRRQMNNTDEFLSKHPEMAKQLNANPNLIDDPKYLSQHPGLQNYLNEHPGIANEWKNHPQAFADAARADERYNKTGQVPPVGHQTKAAVKK